MNKNILALAFAGLLAFTSVAAFAVAPDTIYMDNSASPANTGNTTENVVKQYQIVAGTVLDPNRVEVDVHGYRTTSLSPITVRILIGHLAAGIGNMTEIGRSTISQSATGVITAKGIFWTAGANNAQFAGNGSNPTEIKQPYGSGNGASGEITSGYDLLNDPLDVVVTVRNGTISSAGNSADSSVIDSLGITKY